MAAKRAKQQNAKRGHAPGETDSRDCRWAEHITLGPEGALCRCGAACKAPLVDGDLCGYMVVAWDFITRHRSCANKRAEPPQGALFERQS